MSDQSPSAQKPKPGSLRDRIAAFEKSATAGAAPVHAPPPPRPKPAGFATWKPKQASPPSSPPPATQTEPLSSMSASDARESITKGASLRERMAALQNKGAFGAPAPVGPKPVVERPKWKPPPVVHSEEADGPTEGVSAIEKSIAPSLGVRQEQSAGDSVQTEQDPPQGVAMEEVKEDGETTQDPEEEERQRRAAIAARMARLGGARVGMAPPIIGKKPLVRRPTQEEQQKAVEDTQPSEPEPSASPEEPKPSSTEPPAVSLELENQKPGLTPSRKSSMNTTAEVVSGHSPKIPTSMPVPAVPRRAGPPRKKPSKPTAPPPEMPKEDPTVPDADLVSVPVLERPESTSIGPIQKETSITIEDEVSASAGALEKGCTLHDDSEELHESEAVKSEEFTLPPPLPDSHSPVLQQSDLPPHSLETSETIEIVDEEASQYSSSPSATPSIPAADINATERASNVIEYDEAKDGKLMAEPQGADLTSELPEEMHPEPQSDREDSLHEDGNESEVVGNDPKSDKASDQSDQRFSTDVCPIPADRPTLSSTIDASQFSGHSSASLGRRSLPPPRRIIPPPPEGDTDQELVEDPESDEEPHENLARSHLIIPPPKERRPMHAKHRNIQDEDDGAGDDSENDTPALPVPHRRSMDMRSSRSILPAMSDSSSEPDTDHDGQPLPVPPRPTTRVASPPRSQESSQYDDERTNLSINISTSIPLDREIMDEDVGDPIDPDFHIPSRRSSYLNLAHRATSPSTPLGPPPQSSPRPQSTLQPVQYISSSPRQINQPEQTTTIGLEEDTETRKRTIAERMARLGGIKFGAAPIPRPTFAVQESERADATGIVEDNSDEPSNEEEEERTRKERIAAKLASMGGMRIGMMPVGMGSMPAKGPQFQGPVPSSPPNPVVPVRPSRVAPPPPLQTREAEVETGSPNTSDDGVQVEAEESEAEEVNYQDAEPEEAPPIPSRSGRPTRRQSSDTAVSPPPPARRPPVPATPSRRMSTQIPSPPTTPQRKGSYHAPQADYVMVESQDILPTRRTSGGPPARSAPEVAKMAEPQENISAQWELPSIPTAALDFGGSADLSLSWTDAGEVLSPSQPIPSPALRSKARRQPTTEKSLSADDLMAMWGRVGVQVCEVATALFEKSKKSLIGDGSYAGFVKAVLGDVPNAAQISIEAGEYGHLVYSQNGSVVQKRISEIMPGDIVEVHDARFKGHKGLQTYQLTVGGSGELMVGIVTEFEAKKSKIKVFQADQRVGQQTVEWVSYRLEDLKSGTIKIYRVLEAA